MLSRAGMGGEGGMDRNTLFLGVSRLYEVWGLAGNVACLFMMLRVSDGGVAKR